MADGPSPGGREGLSGMAPGFRDIMDVWTEVKINADELEGRESALLTLREGKVVRYEWFHEATDALRAAESRG
jgi:hypothetical protein